MLGWLNSGAPTLMIAHHSLKVRNFIGRSSKLDLFLSVLAQVPIEINLHRSFILVRKSKKKMK